MTFLACLEWFQHIQAKSWQGHHTVSLGPFPLHCTHAIRTFFSLLPTLVLKLCLLFFLSLYQFSHFWAERASCFGCEKSIAITRGRERERGRENTLKREGERLLSLSVWPCLTAVISLNCFANIIPTQPGSRSARPLCWSWLEAVLLRDLSVSLPFFFSLLPPLGPSQLE